VSILRGEIIMAATRFLTAGRRGRPTRILARGLCCGVLALLTIALAGWTSAATSGSRASGSGTALRSALRDDLSEHLASRGQAEHISAISLRVTFPGNKPSIDIAVGTTRYGGGRPVSPRDLWQIGSNTKSFTSVIVLQLEADGKLSIDDTLGKWLPQYPAWKNITIKRLLNMTSGIPDYLAQPALMQALAANPRTAFSERQLVSYVAGLPLFPPGWSYSNTNYILAQMIIEKVTRDSYADQLTKRIIIPLRLHATCLPPYTCPPGTAARMPSGYWWENPPPLDTLNGTPFPKLGLTWAQAAGGIVSSLADLTTWARALYRGDQLPPPQQRQLHSLVSELTGQPMTMATPGHPGFGLGVQQSATPSSGTVWDYEGETPAYRAIHLYQPATGVILALATNSGAQGPDDQLPGLAVTVLKTLQAAGNPPHIK
jgi:D-alanyl-D-alanine carboxypeptidase